MRGSMRLASRRWTRRTGVKTMDPKVIWGPASCVDEDPIFLFDEEQSALDYYSPLGAAIKLFVDDGCRTVPARAYRTRPLCDCLVQNYFFHFLPCVNPDWINLMPSILEDSPELGLHDHIEKHFFCVEGDPVSKHVLSQCHLPTETNDLPDINPSQYLFEGVKRIHVPLANYESAKATKIDVLAPEALNCNGFKVDYVTSGSPWGVPKTVEMFEHYWMRFLIWNRSQYDKDGGRCTLSMSHVNTFPLVSPLGFFRALIKLKSDP